MNLEDKIRACFSVSGNEDQLITLLRNELSQYFDETKSDVLGNLVFHKSGGEKVYLFTIHVDRPGLIVTGCDGDKVRIASLGKVDMRSIPFARVKTVEGKCGVLIPPKEITADTSLSDYTADFGEGAELQSGDRLEYCAEKYAVGGASSYLGSGLEAAICSLASSARDVVNSENEIYFVFTTQGALGGRNLAQAVRGIQADEVFDINICDCTNDDKKVQGGAVVRTMTKNYSASPMVADRVKTVLDAKSIPYTVKVDTGVESEAGVLASVGTGLAVCELCLPVSFMSTHAELVANSAVMALTDSIMALL